MGLPSELRDLVASVERVHRRIGHRAGTTWDPHIVSDPVAVYRALASLPLREGMFLEWGSGVGMVALIAAAMGFESYGIESNPALVHEATQLAKQHVLPATFVTGSFVPLWYEPDPEVLDEDLVHESAAADGYEELGLPSTEFDVIYGFPWPGAEAMFYDLFEQIARDGAVLIANLSSDGMDIRTKRGPSGRNNPF